MQKMVKGANVGLAALSEDVGSVMMSLGWSSPTGEGDADVSVLLLDGNGKVRSDADFCFYNNPIAGNGSVQLLGKTPTADGNEDRISFDLDAVPPEVEQIVVAASRYGGSRFGDLNDLHLTLADSSGDSLVQFSIEDAGAVAPSSSASSTGVPASGSSVPSGRVTRPAWAAWRRTSASTSTTTPRTRPRTPSRTRPPRTSPSSGTGPSRWSFPRHGHRSPLPWLTAARRRPLPSRRGAPGPVRPERRSRSRRPRRSRWPRTIPGAPPGCSPLRAQERPRT